MQNRYLNYRSSHGIALFSAVLLVLGSAISARAEMSPGTMSQDRNVEDMTYITGGIGDEEQQAMEGVRSQYNLHVVTAQKNGDYEDDTIVSIYNSRGERILNAESGPMLFAKLPPGSYTLVANNESREIRKKVTLGHKPTDVGLYW